MDDYCNGCGKENVLLISLPNGHTSCSTCNYEDFWYGKIS